MGVESTILDGFGSPSKLRISSNGAAYTVMLDRPAIGDGTNGIPHTVNFVDSNGSSDMAVNGGTTNVDFSVTAVADYDLYIRTISAVIGDGGSPNLQKFGNLTALTNGVQWKWQTGKDGESILSQGIKTNLEFIRIGNATAAIGTGSDSFLADVSGGGTEKSYLPRIDMSKLFGGTGFGIRLRKGSTDKLTFTVRDDLSGLSTFDILAFGKKYRE